MTTNRVGSVNRSANSRILISPSSGNVSVSKRKLFRSPKSVQEKVLCHSLCFLFVAIMVLLAALCILAHRWKATLSKLTYTYSSEDMVCDSEACQESAQKLQSNLDPTADPCVDFYQYACGGWMEKNPLPEGKRIVTPFSIRKKEVEDTVVDLLTSVAGDVAAQPRAIAALGRFFGACKDADSRARVGIEPLSRLLREFGGWPMVKGAAWKAEGFSWYEQVARGNRDLYLDMMVDFRFDKSDHDAKNFLIFLRRGTYIFERHFMDFLDDSKTRPHVNVTLLDSIVKSARLLGSTLDTETLRDQAREIIWFEYRLFLIGDIMDDYEKYEATMGELDRNVTGPLEKFPGFSFKTFLNLHLRSNILVSDETSMILESLSHFLEMPSYLDEVHPRHVANYISYRIVHTFAVYTVQDVWGDLGIQEKREWMNQTSCLSVANTFMPHALSRLYVDKHFPPLTRYHVNKMVDMIRLAYSSTLDQNSWMDKSTMLYSLVKLQSMESFIGYPGWIADDALLDQYYEKALDLKEDDYFGAVVQLCKLMGDVNVRLWNQTARRNDTDAYSLPPFITVNAFYVARYNAMVLPAGILGYPFYKYNRIDAINYGAIGTLIGHEFSHGFDDYGSDYDHLGNLKNWWTEERKKKFLKKAQCFVEQYENFLEEDDPMRVDGEQTISENIADNGGVRNAFKAFRLHLALSDEDMSNRRVLPGLPATPEQLFFLGYASIWCANMTEEHAKRLRQTDVHSLNKLRVNVPLANFIEFARAFKCNPGTSMNPRHKCVLW